MYWYVTVYGLLYFESVQEILVTPFVLLNVDGNSKVLGVVFAFTVGVAVAFLVCLAVAVVVP